MEIIGYFSEDLIQIFYIIGSLGGFIYWFEFYRKYPRLRVRIDKEGLFSSQESKELILQFEAENLGMENTSLDPIVSLVGLDPIVSPVGLNPTVKIRDLPVHGIDQKFNFKIQSDNRVLLPYTPKMFKAVYKADNSDLQFLHFKKYRFSVTRGRPRYIYIRDAGGEVMPYINFLFCQIAFKYFGRLCRNR